MIEKRNKIIMEIFTSPLINSAIKKICPAHLREDFQQHFYIQLLEMKPAKLIKAHGAGYLDWLCVRVLSNQMNSNTSSFWKYHRNMGSAGERKIWLEAEIKVSGSDEGMYLGNPVEKTGFQLENISPEDESENLIRLKEEHEQKRLKVLHLLNSRHYYHRHLYILHLDGMTYRQIEKATLISYQSVRLSILATTEWLKNKI